MPIAFPRQLIKNSRLKTINTKTINIKDEKVSTEIEVNEHLIKTVNGIH